MRRNSTDKSAPALYAGGNAENKACLMSLPTEILRLIILDAIFDKPRQAPTLATCDFKNRACLRNRFDSNEADKTNIYVQRGRHNVLNAGALQQTNRRLHNEYLDIVEKTLKRAKAQPPFVLDLMVVKDVGILPTWLNFPFVPHQIDRLDVRLRIFRPSKDIPAEWIDAAEFPLSDGGESANNWNFAVIFSIYALNLLSPTKPAGEENAWKEVDEAREANCVTAYRASAAMYTVKELFIDFEPHEYWPSGERIMSGVEDYGLPNCPECHTRFGRAIFNETFQDHDYHTDDVWIAGKWACYLLWDNICRIMEDLPYDALDLYFYALASNVGTIVGSDNENKSRPILGDPNTRSPNNWFYVMLSNYGCVLDNVVDDLRTEKKKSEEMQNKNLLRALTIAKRRIDLGWWDYEAAEEVKRRGRYGPW